MMMIDDDDGDDDDVFNTLSECVLQVKKPFDFHS